ncbi:MAG: histidine kinase [Flavobacteriia bacterium]|nr:MAG: histidine kinase [Flavobacteriia bacterium]
MSIYDTTLVQIEQLVNNKDLDRHDILQRICDVLQNTYQHYDWVGFYLANKAQKTLHLEAFAGEPTTHDTIPFGKGICGQVAVSNQVFLVPDVTLQNNYIACSPAVKSEIVVPLWVNGDNIGQIDIDSHTDNAFSPEDETFLIAVNKLVAQLF